MLELTGMGSVLRGIGMLYWLLAIAAVALAIWKGKGRRGKAIWAVVAIAVFGFLPVKGIVEQAQRDAYAREAWAYFKKKCETEAGEKIYKTFTGVKSVLVVKPLPPATEKDLFDQFWYGDPYSDATPWDRRAELAASRLAWSDGPLSRTERGKGFDFVESIVADRRKELIRYVYPKGDRNHTTQLIEKPVSRFGVSWEDISTPEGRRYWVAASRLRVIDLSDSSVVAERVGFLIEAGFGSTSGGRRPWLAARGLGQNGRSCPDAHDYSDRWFILKVLKPTDGAKHGK
jgi:hypothetical protein